MHLTVLRGPVDVGIFELHEGDNVAGRAPDCDVCLPSKRVSRRHCIFSVLNGQVIVRDLGSHNGIVEMGSGRRVEQLRMLPGGRIQLGDFVLTLDAEMTENELQDDDDDVQISTSEIEGGGPLDEDDLDTAEEELSLDDTASAIRAARRPPPPPRPEPPPRRPAAQPVLVRSERRGPPAAPAPRPSGRLAALAVDEARPTGLLAEEPRRAPAPVEEPRQARGLPVSPDDPTPRPGPPVITPRPRPTVVPTPPAAVVPLPGSAADMDVPTSPGGPPPPPLPTARPAPRRADPPASRRTDPLRDTVPPPRAAPVPEVRVGVVPWALQAVGALLLVWSLVVCAPVGGTVALVRGQATVAHDAAVREAVATASTLAARNAVPLAAGDTAHLDLSLVSGIPGVTDVRVTDVQGAVLAPRDKLRILLSDHESMRGAMTDGVATATPTLGGTVEVAAPIRLAADQPVVGYAWVEFSTNRAAADLANPWLAAFAAALVFGAGIVGSALACWALVLRPVERLAFGAERLAAGRGQQLAPVPNWEGYERIARSLHELAARPSGGGGDLP